MFVSLNLSWNYCSCVDVCVSCEGAVLRRLFSSPLLCFFSSIIGYFIISSQNSLNSQPLFIIRFVFDKSTRLISWYFRNLCIKWILISFLITHLSAIGIFCFLSTRGQRFDSIQIHQNPVKTIILHVTQQVPVCLNECPCVGVLSSSLPSLPTNNIFIHSLLTTWNFTSRL